MSLRDEFPVFERLSFLNAGSDGPVPRRSAEAAADEVSRQVTAGRDHAYFMRRGDMRRAQAAAYAGLLGCSADEVSLTTCTTDGIAIVAEGFGPGDKILTSDVEHPGVYGPLAQARGRGAEIVVAPFAQLHEAVDSSVSAVVCSHISWVSGLRAPAELASVDVPVIYDGAQGIGAVAVDVRALGCAAYAASGQKWLCGPDGSGTLFIDPAFRERVPAVVASYWNLEDAGAGLDASLWGTGRAWDAAGLSGETSRYALESLAVLEEAGWENVHREGAALAANLASLLEESGRTVWPRSDTTLVSWEDPDPPANSVRLFEAGVLIRDLPNLPLLRASVGAWNDESDLERLLAAL